MTQSTKRSRSRKGQQAYLLRMWWEGPEPKLRIVLIDTATRERHGSSSLENLYSFLHQKVTSEQEAS